MHLALNRLQLRVTANLYERVSEGSQEVKCLDNAMQLLTLFPSLCANDNLHLLRGMVM